VYRPDPQNPLEVPTVYRNATGIYVLLTNKAAGSVIDKSSTSAAASSDEAGAYDGNTQNRWQSDATGYPHFITIDLGMHINVARLGIYPSLFNSVFDTRMPSRIEWWVSADNTNWIYLGEFAYDNSPGSWASRVFDVQTVNARYVKLVGLEDDPPSASGIMCLGEIDVYTKLE
jgi:hypothetical protein